MFLIRESFHEPMKGSKSPSRPWSPEWAPGHSRVGRRGAASTCPGQQVDLGTCLPVSSVARQEPPPTWVCGCTLPAWVGWLYVFGCVCAAGGRRGCGRGCKCGAGQACERVDSVCTWARGVWACVSLRSECAGCAGLQCVQAPPVCECDVLHTGVLACCLPARVLHVKACARSCAPWPPRDDMGLCERAHACAGCDRGSGCLGHGPICVCKHACAQGSRRRNV